ncbi:MAG: capsule assembly Wzi family protein [Desulfobacteraceae bacterium]|nr:MAG: capsule assembly Wzi family protein [Desulfobacteraceae bacterium]
MCLFLNTKRFVFFISLLAFASVSVDKGAADSSVTVPPDSALYPQLELLAGRNLIQSGLFSTKPFTRYEAARLVLEAVKASANHAYPFADSSKSIIERLQRDYEEELTDLQSGDSAATILKPFEAFSVQYQHVHGPFAFFNREGISYHEGGNARAEFQSRAKLGHVFSFFLQPGILYRENAGNAEGDSETKIRLQKGYATLTLDHSEIQVGRDALWWGPGYHGALLMSNNARPFDMVKWSNSEADLLPGLLKSLGPFRYQIVFSRFNDERKAGELVEPYFYGLRLDFKPHPYFEVGLSQACLFGGEGRRNLSFSDLIRIFYGNKDRSNTKLDSNQQVALDLALMFPDMRRTLFLADSVKVYAEIGAEDMGFLPDKRAYIFGLALNDFLLMENLRLRMEYANTVKTAEGLTVWYQHGSYPMTHEGRIFGHHAGTDADDLFFELSREDAGPYSYGLGFDLERSGIQTSRIVQKRRQIFLNLGYRFNPRAKIQFYGAQERIDNYNYLDAEIRRHHYFGVEFQLDF